MGSASYSSQKLKLTSVSTDTLKDRLNGLYQMMQSRKDVMVTPGLFEYLWDLKELALVEGKRSVEVPEPWLHELEESCLDGGSKRLN